MPGLYSTIKQTTSWAQILTGNLSSVEQMWNKCLVTTIRGMKKKECKLHFTQKRDLTV